MSTELRVPSLPESVADATVLEWHKNIGDAVRQHDKLLDLETDKVVLEVPAPCDGILTEILVPTGETVSAATLLARISETSAASPPSPPRPADPPVAPSARRLIKELGLSEASIAGSGRDGRVHKADVLAWLDRQDSPTAEQDDERRAFESQAEASAPSASPQADAMVRAEQRLPMTRLRARIAERLLEAQQQTATLTTFNEADMSAVMALRQRYREEFERQHGVRLGIMSFFVKAAVAALRQFPILNATIDGEDILYRDFQDIGIAVSTERGLVVPILRDCDRLDLAAIEIAIAEFARKARDASLSLDELTGGTFSITNGGVFGSLLSTPIINPPQSAILGLHKIEERPVAIAGRVEIRAMMYLALSYDHRLIDGRDAVRFLVAIKQMIEDPARLLLNL